MNKTMGTRRAWGLTLGGLVLGMASSGCVYLIAQSYPTIDQAEIDKPTTRAEARGLFGEPATSASCADGSQADQYNLRVGPSLHGSVLAGEYGRCFTGNYIEPCLLLDAAVTPYALYRRAAYEPEVIQVSFVSAPDGQILYRYSSLLDPNIRFVEAMQPLTQTLWRQLQTANRPLWKPLTTTYAAQVRRRAACVGHTLTPRTERILRRVLALGDAVDAGGIITEDALAALDKCPGEYVYLAVCDQEDLPTTAPVPPHPSTQEGAAAGPE